MASRIHSVEAIEGAHNGISADHIDHYIDALNNAEIYPTNNLQSSVDIQALNQSMRKDIDEGAFFYTDIISDGVEVENDTNFTEEAINNFRSEIQQKGGLALNVKNISSDQLYEHSIESVGEKELRYSVSVFMEKISAKPIKEINPNDYKPFNKEFSAEGATPSAAVLNAIQDAAGFEGVNIKVENFNSDDEHESKHAVSLRNSSISTNFDSNIIIRGIEVKKSENIASMYEAVLKL